MDIEFCQGCDGSISRRDIEDCSVVRVGGRPYHRDCAPAKRSVVNWLPWVLVLPALAAGFLVGAVIHGPTPPPPPKDGPDPVLLRQEETAEQIQGLSRQVESATQSMREQSRELARALESFDETLRVYGEDLELLAGALEGLAKRTAAPVRPEESPAERERLETLLAAATSREFGERFTALHQLSLRPEKEAAEALRKALADPNRRIRAYAARLLAERGEMEVAGLLVTLLRDDEPVVRQAAHRALLLLSGLPYAFDALAPEAERAEQAKSWERWWADR